MAPDAVLERDNTTQESLQQILQRVAAGELSEAEAKTLLEVYWEAAHSESLARRLIRLLLPSLSRTTYTSR